MMARKRVYKTKVVFNNTFLLLAAALLAVVATLILNFSKRSLTQATSPLTLPETSSSWVNQGVAISEGAQGEWDRYLWGAFANSIVKKDGVYYHYYQGSEGYDDTCGDNVYRQIGVATSTDGINWTKYSGNPVISWVDSGVVTEGAVSSGALMGSDGNIYIYYGANSAYSGCLVHSSGRVARSTDGINFTDVGEVIPNTPPLWGSGDEIFPVGAYLNGNNWYVFYIPNGVSQTKKLGVVTGTSASNFDITTSRGVNGGNLLAWGPVSIVNDIAVSYAFVNEQAIKNPANRSVKVYSFSPSTPSSMALQKTYNFSDCIQASVLYEPELSRWLMLCRDRSDSAFYRVKTAAIVVPTSTPVLTSTPVIKPGQTNTPAPTPIPSSKSTVAPTSASTPRPK